MIKNISISAALIAGIALTCVVVVVSSVRWVTTYYSNGVEFVGYRSVITPLEYFSVRIRCSEGMPSMIAGHEIYLRMDDKRYRLSEIHLQQLIPLAPVSPEDSPRDADRSFFFLGGNTPDNRDYGIEFRFSDDRLCEFYLRNKRSDVMPVSLELDSGTAFEFPISGGNLTELFGEPERTESRWGY